MLHELLLLDYILRCFDTWTYPYFIKLHTELWMSTVIRC